MRDQLYNASSTKYFWADCLQGMLVGNRDSLQAPFLCLTLLDHFPSPPDRYHLSAVFNDIFQHVSNLQLPATGNIITIRDFYRRIAVGGTNPIELRVLALEALRLYVQVA